MVHAEDASGDPNARNASTSATGVTQFTKGTWLDVMNQYLPGLADWYRTNKDALLDLRRDPQLSRLMAGAYADMNARALERANFPVTPNNLYVTHFLGPGDGPKLLAAMQTNPNALARSVIGPDSVRANRKFITPTMTVKQLIDELARRMGPGP